MKNQIFLLFSLFYKERCWYISIRLNRYRNFSKKVTQYTIKPLAVCFYNTSSQFQNDHQKEMCVTNAVFKLLDFVAFEFGKFHHNYTRTFQRQHGF